MQQVNNKTKSHQCDIRLCPLFSTILVVCQTFSYFEKKRSWKVFKVCQCNQRKLLKCYWRCSEEPGTAVPKLEGFHSQHQCCWVLLANNNNNTLLRVVHNMSRFFKVQMSGLVSHAPKKTIFQYETGIVQGKKDSKSTKELWNWSFWSLSRHDSPWQLEPIQLFLWDEDTAANSYCWVEADVQLQKGESETMSTCWSVSQSIIEVLNTLNSFLM